MDPKRLLGQYVWGYALAPDHAKPYLIVSTLQ